MTNEAQQRVERSTVLLLLDRDRWTIAELQNELAPQAEGLVTRHVLGELQAVRLAVIDGDGAQASPALRRLDELELIAP